MKRFRSVLLIILIMTNALLLNGCKSKIVPAQYDLKLKTTENELSCDLGGGIIEVEINIDSRRYKDLSSEDNIFLSYHVRDAEGNILEYDGLRSSIELIKARGVGKRTLQIEVPKEKGDYLIEVDLVEEGVTWFSEQGMETINIPLEVLN